MRHPCVLALSAVLVWGAACGEQAPPPSVGRTATVADRDRDRIDEALTPALAGELREGLAAAIAIDVSGSMDDRVVGQDGRRARKIDVARRAARAAIDQFASYAEAHPDEPVLLGIYEFSRRDGVPDARPVVPMGPPDRSRADAALARLEPDGGTPIGEAMIVAKRDLDATGLSRRHLIIVSDGENTDGFPPERVAAGINRRPEGERPSMYFVAFDVEARRFARLRDAGTLVLPAASGKDLNDTLDMLLTGRILLEK